jgi:DNA polymerase-1
MWMRLAPDAPDRLRLAAPVQATAADGLKDTLIHLWERREECPGAVLVLVSHDEVLVECPAEQAEAAAEWLRQAMVAGMAPLLDCLPVVVTLGRGQAWA